MNSLQYERLSIKPDTKQLLKLCIKEYLDHHPEMQHIHITEDKIVFEVCNYYLNN